MTSFEKWKILPLLVTNGKNATAPYDVPVQNAKVIDGHCDEPSPRRLAWFQRIAIQWTDKGTNNTMDVSFKIFNYTHKLSYALTKITFKLSASILPDGNDEQLQFTYNGMYFVSLPIGRSYYCENEKELLLQSPRGNGTLLLSDLQVEVFEHSGTEFSDPYNCKTMQNSASKSFGSTIFQSTWVTQMNLFQLITVIVGSFLGLSVLCAIPFIVYLNRKNQRNYSQVW